MIKNPPKKLKILGVGVSIAPKNRVLDFISSSLKKSKFYIVTPNPEIILLAQKDTELKDALNQADIALADGTGIVWAAKSIYGNKIPRLQGRVMFEELLKLANANKLKVFLLGASKEVSESSINKIKGKFSKISVQGRFDININNKGYSDNERDRKIHIDILNDINKFKPDILFVALGAPKQEKWIYHNIDNLDISFAMVIGGALDTFSGKLSKPPMWMEKQGLEWIWRLIQQPHRIKRILNATIVFPFKVMIDKLSR